MGPLVLLWNFGLVLRGWVPSKIEVIGVAFPFLPWCWLKMTPGWHENNETSWGRLGKNDVLASWRGRTQILRIFQHTPGTYPKTGTNGLCFGIPFILGFGDAWDMLQGYVGVLLNKCMLHPLFSLTACPASKHQCFLSRLWSQDWLEKNSTPNPTCDPLDPDHLGIRKLTKPGNPHNCSSSTISTSPSRSQPSKPAPHVSHRFLRLLCASCLKPLGSRRSRILEKITKVEVVSGAWVGWAPSGWFAWLGSTPFRGHEVRPEPPQLAQNTPRSTILCKDPIAFCCWGKIPFFRGKLAVSYYRECSFRVFSQKPLTLQETITYPTKREKENNLQKCL